MLPSSAKEEPNLVETLKFKHSQSLEPINTTEIPRCKESAILGAPFPEDGSRGGCETPCFFKKLEEEAPKTKVVSVRRETLSES